MRTKKRLVKYGIFIGLLVCLIIVLIPFYIVVANSFKPYSEIAKNIFSLPQHVTAGNYREAWRRLNFANSLKNTFTISVLSNFGGVVFSSMCGYWICRHKNHGTKFVYYILIAFMSIPFQALMIPFAKITSRLHLTNSLFGLSVCFWALTVPISTFIAAGAVKSVPVEIEESALIDGCSHFRMYWLIVFPLIKSSVFTFVTINTLWFWNDYLMTQLMLSKKSLRTIQISMQALFNEAFFAWDVALAALTLSILPLFLFFVIAQKQVLEGAAAGAVKG